MLVEPVNATLTPVCPSDGTARCFHADGGEVERFLSVMRNCNGGSGPECTINDPCYPCELDTIYVSFCGL